MKKYFRLFVYLLILSYLILASSAAASHIESVGMGITSNEFVTTYNLNPAGLRPISWKEAAYLDEDGLSHSFPATENGAVSILIQNGSTGIEIIEVLLDNSHIENLESFYATFDRVLQTVHPKSSIDMRYKAIGGLLVEGITTGKFSAYNQSICLFGYNSEFVITYNIGETNRYFMLVKGSIVQD